MYHGTICSGDDYIFGSDGILSSFLQFRDGLFEAASLDLINCAVIDPTSDDKFIKTEDLVFDKYEEVCPSREAALLTSSLAEFDNCTGMNKFYMISSHLLQYYCKQIP